LQPSLFKFQLVREGELFHNLSPWLWAIAPFVMFLLGAYTGTHSINNANTVLTPVIIYTFIAIIGVFDPFSGIAAAIGFMASNSVVGNISNIHSLLSSISFACGWFFPGICASLLQDSIRRDWIPRFPRKMLLHLPLIASAFLGGASFYALELLTNSFSNQFGPLLDPGIFAPLTLTASIFARIKLDQYLIRDLHLRGKNYQIRSITLSRVVAPQTVLIAALYAFGASYSWTGDLKFSTLLSGVIFVSLGLLIFRFESSYFIAAKFITRHLLLEAFIALILGVSIFIYVGSLPLELTTKGEYLLLSAGLIALLHSIYSALHDSAHRKNMKLAKFSNSSDDFENKQTARPL
jgi:hypothetical protein